MIIRIFKTNQIIANIFVVILALVLWIPGYYTSISINQPYFSLFNLFGKWVFDLHFINILLSSLLIGLQAVLLNYIVNEEKLIKDNTHLVALFYVILNSSSSLLFTINPLIIVNIFVIIVLYLFFKMYNLNDVKSTLFNAGLLIGVGSLFFSPILVLFPLLWIVLSYLRPPRLKDYFMTLIGVLLPLAYLVAIIYLTDQLFSVNAKDWFLVTPVFNVTDFSSYNFLLISLTVILLIAIFQLFIVLSREVVKTRKLYFVVILLSLFLVSSSVLFKFDFLALFVLLTIPLSIFLANYFYRIKREWLAELLFATLCIGIVLGYFL